MWWGPRSALAPVTLSESQITITTAASFPSTLHPHFTDEQNNTQDVPKRTGLPGPWFVPGLDVGHLSSGPLLGPLSFPAGLMGLPSPSQLVTGEVQQQPIPLSGEWITQASGSCSCFILISIITITERENSPRPGRPASLGQLCSSPGRRR